jgi:hypothetical protein
MKIETDEYIELVKESCHILNNMVSNDMKIESLRQVCVNQNKVIQYLLNRFLQK